MPMILDPNWQRGYLVPYGRDKRTGQGGMAVPGVVQDMLSALMLPGDVYQGKIPILDPNTGRTSDQAIRGSADLAGSLSFGGPAVTGATRMAAGKRAIDPNVVNIFAGPTAKTADKGALQMAQDMAANGIARDDIWNKTGWFQGVDGKWRFEIDDSQSILTDRARKELTANTSPDGGIYGASQRYTGGTIDHAPLFSAYPQMHYGMVDARHNTRLDPAFIRGKFGYQEDAGGIPHVLAESNSLNDGPDSVKGVMLHELQHNVQDLEGFARGANSKEYGYGPLFNDTANSLQLELSKKLTGGISSKPKELKTILKYGDPAELDSIAKKHGFQSIDEAMAFLLQEDDYRTPYGQYKRTAGEVESRNVQRRMNMTPQERKATPPWATYDIPENRQIVRFR